MDSDVDLERIMPSGCTDKRSFGVDDEQFPVYKDRLGYLTLLEKSFNRSIRNADDTNKAVSYKSFRFYVTYSISGYRMSERIPLSIEK